MLKVIFDAARADRLAPLRVIMLPAAFSTPEDFVQAGFASVVRERGLDIDLVFVSVRLPHLTDYSGLERLRGDLILPAHAAGCAVWLGGISLGGYLALCCAERHSSELAGLCLFAPYLGSHRLTAEIARAHGAHQWMPEYVADDDDERRVWRFIRTLRGGALPVHLGLGREDRFAGRHRLFAAALAPETVDVVSGGHDWPTWRTLWERFVDARLASPRDNLADGHRQSAD